MLQILVSNNITLINNAMVSVKPYNYIVCSDKNKILIEGQCPHGAICQTWAEPVRAGVKTSLGLF